MSTAGGRARRRAAGHRRVGRSVRSSAGALVEALHAHRRATDRPGHARTCGRWPSRSSPTWRPRVSRLATGAPSRSPTTPRSAASPADRVMEAARSLDLHREPTPLVISACVQMPSLDLVQAAEDEFGLPVLSAATAGAYSLLRASACRSTSPVPGRSAARRRAGQPPISDPNPARRFAMTELRHTASTASTTSPSRPSTPPRPSGSTATSSGSRSCTRSAPPAGAGEAPRLHPLLLRHRQRRPDRVLLLLRPGHRSATGRPAATSYARFAEDVPGVLRRLPPSRDPRRQRGRPARVPAATRRVGDWPVEMQVLHETIESIYTHDPNGYMIEITRALRPVTPQEDLDAELTVDALSTSCPARRPDDGQAADPQGRADRRTRRRVAGGPGSEEMVPA